MKIYRIILCAAAALAVAGAANAATINWLAPQKVVDANDVINTGSTFTAWTAMFEGYPPTFPSTIVNGVEFKSTDGGVGDNITLAGFSGWKDPSFNGNLTPADFGSPEYAALMQWGWWTWGADPCTVTLSNLTVGNEYQVQLWVQDARIWGVPRNMLVDGHQINFNQGTEDSVGNYIVGTFTADASSQVINLLGNESTLINAIQVRTSAVPEPGSIVALLSGLAGLAGFGACRRKA